MTESHARSTIRQVKAHETVDKDAGSSRAALSWYSGAPATNRLASYPSIIGRLQVEDGIVRNFAEKRCSRTSRCHERSPCQGFAAVFENGAP